MSEEIKSIDEELTDETVAENEDVLLDEELDEVSGGAGVVVGNRTFLATKKVVVYDTYMARTQRVVGQVAGNMYLRNCKTSYVANTGVTWIQAGGYSKTRYGSVFGFPGNMVGWIQMQGCVET